MTPAEVAAADQRLTELIAIGLQEARKHKANTDGMLHGVIHMAGLLKARGTCLDAALQLAAALAFTILDDFPEKIVPPPPATAAAGNVALVRAKMIEDLDATRFAQSGALQATVYSRAIAAIAAIASTTDAAEIRIAGINNILTALESIEEDAAREH